MLKRTFVLLGVAVLALAGVVALRGAAYDTGGAVTPVERVDFPVDADRAVMNLAAALRFPTINDDGDGTAHAAAFEALRAFLETAYPAAHTALEREIIGGGTLLYRWDGSDSSLSPILLMGHMDVVPVEPGTEGDWLHDPFAGTVADGFLWGRGALDNKQNVIGILEAVEHLLAEGFTPTRTVYLLFGHDEESGGNDGAATAAALLEERRVRFDFVLDEGGLIMDPAMFGTAEPIAIVKTAEKGYLTLELSVRGAGGHSSRPPRETPIGILSHAIVRLEENPFPARLDGAAEDMIAAIIPTQGAAARTLFANRWLLDGMLLRLLARDPSTNASIRTTVAPTMLHGSPKDNVLPSRASAVVNFRLLPGDSVASVIERVRHVIADDRVEIATRMAVEPSPTSDSASPNFALLGRTIRQVAGNGIRITPYLALGATDSRHFTALSDDVYGFSPALGDDAVLAQIHGTNERIAIEDVERMVRFYVQLVRNAAGNR